MYENCPDSKISQKQYRENKKRECMETLSFLAEGEGFKPPIPERGIPDFESSAIDHSANLPFAFCGCKVNTIFRNSQNNCMKKFWFQLF